MSPRARRPRRLVLPIVCLLVPAAFLLGNVWFGHPVEHVAYWRWRLLADPADPADAAVRIELLGDSSMLGIGASRPAESLAGRIVEHAGRNADGVRAANRARGGATMREVLEQQLPSADLGHASLVVVSVGSVDAVRGTPPDEFARDAGRLLEALPAHRTVVSDVATVPGVGPYQDALAAHADRRGIRRIPFAESFEAARRFDVMAPDGIHLNSVGHGIWFDGAAPVLDEVLAP